MIAKRVARDRGTSSFARLARYVLDQGHGGEKAAAVRVTNCASEDPEWAVREVVATQALNTRSKADKTCHLVVSFPAGERPTPEQLADIEDTLAAAVGLADHQRISALHQNTAHAHLHIAINKVHPFTHRCVQVLRDYFRLDEACRLLEQRHGLAEDNRIARALRQIEPPAPPRTMPVRAAELEAHAGEGSFLRWVRDRRAEIEAARDRSASWEEFHRSLVEHGLQLHQRGAGLVLRTVAGDAAVKVSQVSRELALAPLKARWGDYQPAAAAGAPGRPPQAYQRQPMQRATATPGFYDEFTASRNAAQIARREFAQHLRAEADQQRAALAHWYVERRLLVKNSHHMTKVDKKIAYRKLAEECRADAAAQRTARTAQRAALDRAHPLVTWGDFLRRSADVGDVRALEVLRSREQKQPAAARRLLTAPDAAAAKQVLLEGLKREIQKNGDVLYRLRDGGVVRDSAREVHVDEPTTVAAFAALSLTQQRFPGQALIIEGSAEFRAQVVQVAAARGIDVTFADPQLEAQRLAARAPAAADVQQAALSAYIDARNELANRLSGESTILHHRTWTPTDAGNALYRGRRQLDGLEIVLLEREEEMLVKPVTPAQAAKASTWRLGNQVEVDDRGRFHGEARGAERS